MAVATVTSKGQITVPKEVRDDLGLTTGSKLMFVKLGNGQYRCMSRTGSVEDIIGLLHDPKRPTVTIEQMNEAIAEGGAQSGLQGITLNGVR